MVYRSYVAPYTLSVYPFADELLDVAHCSVVVVPEGRLVDNVVADDHEPPFFLQ